MKELVCIVLLCLPSMVYSQTKSARQMYAEQPERIYVSVRCDGPQKIDIIFQVPEGQLMFYPTMVYQESKLWIAERVLGKEQLRAVQEKNRSEYDSYTKLKTIAEEFKPEVMRAEGVTLYFLNAKAASPKELLSRLDSMMVTIKSLGVTKPLLLVEDTAKRQCVDFEGEEPKKAPAEEVIKVGTTDS